MEISEPSSEFNQEKIEEEGIKQLGGIIIILWILISFLSLGFLAALGVSFTTMWEEDFFSGAGLFIFYIFFYGAISLLYIFALVGIKKRRPYTVPLVRVILVLGCFNLVGLILVLSVFWRRVNNPYTKRYLNYIEPISVPKNVEYNNKYVQEKMELNKYCLFCGETIPDNAIFCKKCGKKQD
ncbi:MAG: zinc ribbon domain-containing protein [Candidatus Humimicrobiaceae bacterium]